MENDKKYQGKILKEKKSAKKKKTTKIVTKLVVGFGLLTISFFTCSFISYKISTDAISMKYKESTQKNIDSVGNYVDLGLSNIESKLYELVYDEDVITYGRGDADSKELQKLGKALATKANVAVQTNDFINSITIVGRKSGIASTIGDVYRTGDITDSDAYTYISEQESASSWIDAKSVVWMGSNTFLDVYRKEGVQPYVLSVVQPINQKGGLVIIDVSESRLLSLFSEINSNEGDISGLITEDGKAFYVTGLDESNTTNEINSSLLSTEFIQSAFTQEEQDDDYIRYEGEEYLFVSHYLEKKGTVVFQLVPKETILGSTKKIQQVTNISLFVILFISGITIFLIHRGIKKSIRQVVQPILRIGEGDLTVRIDEARNDEFKDLNVSIAQMVKKFRALIVQTIDIGDQVAASMDHVDDATKFFVKSSEEILDSMQEIQKGSYQQAEDASHCVQQMNYLADSITVVNKNTFEIKQTSSQTQDVVNEGNSCVEDLILRVEDTASMTQRIIECINQLEEYSKEIHGIVESVRDISEQTALLSLNASIEAAQAGEYGRGFSVVASEIRKLASKSQEASNHIADITTLIRTKTEEAVSMAENTDQSQQIQQNALEQTKASFQVIMKQTAEMVASSEQIVKDADSIEVMKNQSLCSVENISAVTEETAASLESIKDITRNQTDQTAKLKESVEKVVEEVKYLQESIGVFQV